MYICSKLEGIHTGFSFREANKEAVLWQLKNVNFLYLFHDPYANFLSFSLWISEIWEQVFHCSCAD